MAKLWQKGYELDTLIEAFTVGRDWELDGRLVAADCTASAAHATMLEAVGLLKRKELELLLEGLKAIVLADEKGEFPIRREDEDCHTAIENFLVASCGDAGKKIHTGRSRNDQVLTALRVYGREAAGKVLEAGLDLQQWLLKCAEENRDVPMPGRTHMQVAMPSSVGLWAAAWAEEIGDDLALLEFTIAMYDQSPLGSAASYGVPLPLDREMSARLLGFSKLQNNVLYANNSRGKFEAMILDALDQLMQTFSKMSQDLILFSLPEFGYFSLPKELCSGSSIMPQKKNPDGLELMRAKAASMSAWASQVKGIIRSLPSGYNRDFQETKEPFILGLELALQAALVMERTISRLEVNRQRLFDAFTPEIFATDAALELVAGGMSFRDAYRKVGTELDQVSGRDPVESIRNRTAAGTAGNLRLDLSQEGIDGARERLASRRGRWAEARKALLGIDFSVV
ncbi:argininosuccinate lyase [Sediminispirochaeta smaragdinae]|uniref:Argininosuccinate lyase n=1 Tax=Sediminispirochaeta smaragdinae (strain DSM 11293 / JCM 15392 / SEBR 4228) TaxID=573413 RepID=E1R7T2_SEDSS|nr:argininosuccinate lyase [Sediminispirochaeta smaragdinae]ADK82787.1 argininosuccinate lyase [Sediminispirochaeta smaragdinae DSM 11293]